MRQGKTSLKRSVVREAFTTPGRNLILLILAVKGEMHGYELLKEIECLTAGLWRPSHGHLYTLLNRMVEEGLLSAREEYRGRVRRVKYSLTRRGLERLAIANDIILQILYKIVRTHEELGRKLRDLSLVEPSKMSVEVVREYLRTLKQIRRIVDDRIEYLESMLRDLGSY